MEGIHWPEFACCLAAFENLGDAAKKRAKICFYDVLKMVRPAPAGAHHFALYDSRVERMGCDVVEVRARVGEDLLAGREIARQDFPNARNQSSKYLIEYRTV